MHRTLLCFCLMVWAVMACSADEKIQISRELLHSTVRIETVCSNVTHVGTGFFYVFNDSGTSGIPVVVTCKHVVEGAETGALFFALAKTNEAARCQEHFTVAMRQFAKCWITHPTSTVDLAVMPIAPLMRALEREGKRLDIFPLRKGLIPDQKEMEGYGVFQEVKFIGYPIGIWDARNNLPVIRRGMTATDPTIDYEGRTEFLIDAAVYPGSSGSPVVIADEGGFSYGNAMYRGTRLRLLGILYAGPQFNQKGKLEIRQIPTAFEAETVTGIPCNLGAVIKAERLDDFLHVFSEIEAKQKELADKASQAIGSQATPQPER